MGGKSTRPVVEAVDLPRLLSPADLTFLHRQFRSFGSHAAHSHNVTPSPRIDKSRFIDIFVAPRFPSFATAVHQRIFTVVDCKADGFIDVEEFLCYRFVLDFAQREDKLRFIFNLFDLAGNGKIDRDKLKRMTVAIASLPPLAPVATPQSQAHAQSPSLPLTYHQFDANKEFGPLLDNFAFFSLFLYDRDGDRALSYSEWRRYCDEDPRIGQMVEEMGAHEAKQREREKMIDALSSATLSSSAPFTANPAAIFHRECELEPSAWEDYRDRMRTAAGLMSVTTMATLSSLTTANSDPPASTAQIASAIASQSSNTAGASVVRAKC